MNSSFSGSSLSDRDFVLAYADEFLGDALISADKSRFEKLMADNEDLQQLLDKYKVEHGELQVFLQGVSLNPLQMETLWGLVQAPEARQTQEMQKIDEVGRLEFLSNLKRRSFVILFFAALVFGVVYAFTSQQQPPFEYLEYIRYEALAMDRSGSAEDFDLVDSDARSILDLYKLDKGLRFTPSILVLNGGWKAVGGSILDYEYKKITMTQYKKGSGANAETVYYFSTSGDLNELLPSEVGKVGGVNYQTYASEYYNIIAFAPVEGTLGFVVGRLAAPDLAALVDQGLKVD